MCIAMGNVLRRDDGAAHRVLDLLGTAPGMVLREVLQLTPEVAAEIASFDEVVFLDADMQPGKPRLERVAADAGRMSLTHALTPAHMVRMAERLFGFHGAAFVCHVPGVDFGAGEGLSPQAEANARAAAECVRTQTGAWERHEASPAYQAPATKIRMTP